MSSVSISKFNSESSSKLDKKNLLFVLKINNLILAVKNESQSKVITVHFYDTHKVVSGKCFSGLDWSKNSTCCWSQ